MLRMLVISNKLSKNSFSSPIDIYTWSDEELPRVSDYEIAVLDMAVENSYNLKDGTFLNLEDDVERLLRAGGVVICLNYLTEKNSCRIAYRPTENRLQYKDVFLAGNKARYEMNYDWLKFDQILAKLNVTEVSAKPGSSFVLVTKKNAYIDYFSNVKEYHKVLDNIEQKKEPHGFMLQVYNTSLDVEVLALAKVTKKPIACVLELFNGSLVFLPQSSVSTETTIKRLYAIGCMEYEANTDKSSINSLSAPDWLATYKYKRENEIDSEIENHNTKINELKRERQRFSKIDVLLYGNGTQLEDAVELALKEMGCIVQKTEPGASVDFKVEQGNSKFAIEVTGIDDKVFKNNKHFAHILHYLPEREEKEKIIFLVNTYRNIDLKDRISKEHFTPPVLEMSRNNHVALMTTADLFKMWVDTINGKQIDGTFEKIYLCDGDFKY